MDDEYEDWLCITHRTRRKGIKYHQGGPCQWAVRERHPLLGKEPAPAREKGKWKARFGRDALLMLVAPLLWSTFCQWLAKPLWGTFGYWVMWTPGTILIALMVVDLKRDEE